MQRTSIARQIRTFRFRFCGQDLMSKTRASSAFVGVCTCAGSAGICGKTSALFCFVHSFETSHDGDGMTGPLSPAGAWLHSKALNSVMRWLPTAKKGLCISGWWSWIKLTFQTFRKLAIKNANLEKIGFQKKLMTQSKTWLVKDVYLIAASKLPMSYWKSTFSLLHISRVRVPDA